MNPRVSAFILKRLGWKTFGPPVPAPKCIILGAPHTSAWDFVISYLFYNSIGGKAYVMVKKDFFVFPIKGLMRKAGAIPVDRAKGASLVKQMVHAFQTHETLQVAIAPEGTRKPTAKWKGGFHTIARAASVPVYFGYFDWGRKEVGVAEELVLTDDMAADIKRAQQWYKDKGVKGKYPQNFITSTDTD
jgi:1-acyl-sn-glycerol-3-phosphate acyltransferase